MAPKPLRLGRALDYMKCMSAYDKCTAVDSAVRHQFLAQYQYEPQTYDEITAAYEFLENAYAYYGLLLGHS